MGAVKGAPKITQTSFDRRRTLFFAQNSPGLSATPNSRANSVSFRGNAMNILAKHGLVRDSESP